MINKLGQLHIKKRSLPQWLAASVFILPFLLSFLIEFLKIPDFVKYTIDLAWVGLFVILFVCKQIRVKKEIAPFVIFIGIWLLYVIVGYIFNYQSPFYFLWGIRNNFRFYVAFIAYTTFLDKDDISSSLKIVDGLFWVNMVVSFVQFFILGYQQDYLGGIFGVGRGCNAYSSVLFAFVVSKSLLQYFNGKEKSWLCFLKCGVSLILAAMAELKFYFVLFILMVIIAMIMTKFSWRQLLTFVLVAIMTMFAGSLLTIIFGENNQLSLETIFELTTSENYASTQDLGRISAIPILSKKILTQWYERLFGMGIGNCDTSAFAICNTPFFQRYEYLHYSWFSSAFLFLETGYVGLLLNLSFYVLIIIFSIKQINKKENEPIYCKMAIIFAIICIILTFYNSALRKEIGYIAYFVLALPFIVNKSSISKN